MDKPQIIQRLENLQVTVSVNRDRIRLTPSSQIPPSLVEEIRENKADLLDYLRQEEARNPSLIVENSTVDEVTQIEFQEIERAVFEKGYVLLWSYVLDDCIAFYNPERDLVNIPPAFVAYSTVELWHLFGDEEYSPSRGDLLRIHEAKKTGAEIIDLREDQA